MFTIKRASRAAALLLFAAAAAVAILLAGAIPGFLPWASAAPPQANLQAAATASCAVSYGALDPTDQSKVNPNKEVPGAVGPVVTQRDIPGIKKELQERRTCGADGKFDPELTATQYADWSDAGLTSHPVAFADIDAFRAQMIANPDLYASTVNELQALENASAPSIQQNIPAGVWSVYVLPDGKGSLTTHIGTSSHVGTAIVFTHGDKVIKYRLECGFQILREKPPAGMQQCTYAECGPPPAHVPTCEETGTCIPGCTSNCTPGCTSNCTPPPCTSMCPKDPADDVTPPQGTVPLGPDPVQPVAPAPKPEPLQPSTPVTQDPGPSVPVQGASPAPAAPAAPSIPSSQQPAPTDPGTHITDPDG